MNTQQDPHEAEVRRIAEILAESFKDSRDRLSSIPTIYKSKQMISDLTEVVINEHMASAREMVSEIANVAKDFHHAGWTNRGAYDHPAPGAKIGQLEFLLQKKGLIPPPKTTDNA